MPLPRRTPAQPPVRGRRIDAANLCLLFAAALATLPWIFGRELAGSNPSAALHHLSKATPSAMTRETERSAPRAAAGNAASTGGAQRTGSGGTNVQLAVYAVD